MSRTHIIKKCCGSGGGGDDGVANFYNISRLTDSLLAMYIVTVIGSII